MVAGFSCALPLGPSRSRLAAEQFFEVAVPSRRIAVLASAIFRDDRVSDYAFDAASVRLAVSGFFPRSAPRPQHMAVSIAATGRLAIALASR